MKGAMFWGMLDDCHWEPSEYACANIDGCDVTGDVIWWDQH